jgi:hypothetical protein
MTKERLNNENFEKLVQSYGGEVSVNNKYTDLHKEAIIKALKSKNEKQSCRNLEKIGIENSLKKEKISTSLYLGTTKGGKKVYFRTEFSKDGIKCIPSVDLLNVGINIDSFNFYNSSGRVKSFNGQFPKRRKGESNFTEITLAYLLAFSHICEYKKVSHVDGVPSRELTRELMYLVMPEVEGEDEDSSFYGITWNTVIKAWELPQDQDFHLYKRYFNSLVSTELYEMRKARDEKKKKRISRVA